MNVRSIKREHPKGAKPRRGRPLVDDKRRLILDAALRTFAERGYHGTAVPEVAVSAGVSTGTLYHYFESKELLVNEVYRDAKQRLRAALLEQMPEVDAYKLDNSRAWFFELWRRLGTFARAEPDAFRFLEMQDHVPYLDAESRKLELAVLAPLVLVGQRLHGLAGGAPIDIVIALMWGAFVGLIKASRLGYMTLDDRRLELAGEACWRMLAPATSRASASLGAPTARTNDELTPRASGATRASDAPVRAKASRSPRTTKGTKG